MKREIKFRVWDRVSGTMRNWDYYWNVFCADIFESDYLTPLQYTGLHDKNGKEIYEGDIIGVPNPDCKYVVMFGVVRVPDNEWYSDNTVAGFYLREISNGRYHHMDLEDYHEIIGNIYEGLYSVVQ
jgi:uncharacterized phage protein (TIGR01671 family)